MSISAIAWLLAYLVLALKGFSRPVYACSAYLLTFFLSPSNWWWGKGLLSSITLRWNLAATLLIIAAILVNWHRLPKLSRADKWFMGLLITYVINAFFVNWLLANLPLESAKEFDLVWKSVGLALLLRVCIWDKLDLDILLMTILVCSAYIGFEVIFNGAGTPVKGRLEGINFPGATGSNGCAAILTISLFCIGYFVVCNPFPYARIVAFLSAPLILDTLLRCNSRGSYLSLAIGGVGLILLANGKSRKYAILIGLGGVAAFLLQAQSGNIWDRLFSISASEEERDDSAEQRVQSWTAGMKMVADYPLGSGGHAAFVSPRGMTYITHIRTDEYRSVHNGYINIMAGWGVQGFALLIAALLTGSWTLIRTMYRNVYDVPDTHTFLGACLIAALVGQLVCTMFGDYLDGEWFFWLVVFGLAYSEFDASQAEDSDAADESLDCDPLIATNAI